jgi:hypothetical protein
MTKKHFEFIAATIAAMPAFSPTLRDQKRSCALAFAKALQETNPKFQRERFLDAACKFDAETISAHFNAARAEMNK